MDNVKRLIVVYAPNSTRAKRYSYARADLIKQAELHGWSFQEIELNDIPYHQAVTMIARQLKNGDLVVAAGGDGTAQVAFNAVYNSMKQAIFTTTPLGNGNDISRAFNGKNQSPTAVFNQSVVDFYPLNVIVNNRLTFTVASYVTFGATTVLVDYLNDTSSRKLRRIFKHLTPAAAVPVGKLGEISRTINSLDFPDFERDGTFITDDSIGFFVISAAHNVLRLPKNIALAGSEFFFHHAATSDKNLAQKVLMAGAWTFRFPGEMTELEELTFKNSKTNILANISGDNVDLGVVKTISAIRSPRPVKILFNK